MVDYAKSKKVTISEVIPDYFKEGSKPPDLKMYPFSWFISWQKLISPLHSPYT
ncbi:MAG: hypothetical protein WBA93_20615 [Microcoleaceae cyanobacterium]